MLYNFGFCEYVTTNTFLSTSGLFHYKLLWVSLSTFSGPGSNYCNLNELSVLPVLVVSFNNVKLKEVNQQQHWRKLLAIYKSCFQKHRSEVWLAPCRKWNSDVLSFGYSVVKIGSHFWKQVLSIPITAILLRFLSFSLNSLSQSRL